MKWALAIGLILCGCASSPEWSSAVAARNSPQQNCAAYAQAVREKMAKDGHVAYLVTYTVSTKQPLPAWARHQVVMYFVGHERWMMDSAGKKPVWVGSDTEPLDKCIQQFHAGQWVYVSNIHVDDFQNPPQL